MQDNTVSAQLQRLGFERVQPGKPEDFAAWFEYKTEVDEKPICCRVVLDIEESQTEVFAFSGPMIHEWHASFADGTPRTAILAVVKDAMAGKTDDDDED